jgi:LysR family transcriptional regulator, low CO2-responsive transcriptional regulator
MVTRARLPTVAIGPHAENPDDSLVRRPFLNYRMVVVSSPDRPLAKLAASPHPLR